MLAIDPDHDPVRVLIAGGGVAALEALLALRARAPRRLDVTLVAPDADFRYRPLLIGEPFGLGHPHRYPLDGLCRDLGATLVRDKVVAVDAAAHTVRTAGAGTLRYDVLLLALGGRALPAFAHGVTFEREHMAEDFDEVLSALDEGFADGLAIVVPHGVSWTLPAYELALLTAARAPDARVTILTHEPRPLGAFGSRASAGVATLLDHAGVTVLPGRHADVATPAALRVDGAWLKAGRIVALPVTTGRRLPGVPADHHGFIPVDDRGRVPGLPDVYAAGDGTTLPVKQGGLAAQQAEAAALDIAIGMGAELEPRPWRPVLRGLLRTAEGPFYLRAELDDPERTSTISQEPLWWPPSKVASRWLGPHLARLDAERAAGSALVVTAA